MYEHSARVPLIITGPRIPQDRRFDEECLCGHYDFIPTLCDLLEIERPVSSEGISYHDVIFGNQKSIRKTICMGYRDCMGMARDDRYKMIYYPKIGKTQLFDLKDAPWELNDLMQEWRRDREAPYEDPAIGGTGEPTPEMPEFLPKVSRQEGDEIVKRLWKVLEEWQEEMADPVFGNGGQTPILFS